MIHIYNKNGGYKITLNYTKEEFNKHKEECYNEWEVGDIASETMFSNPIVENGEIREMTRDELVKNGIEGSLFDGEYIEDNQIKMVEKPQNKFLSYAWDKEAKIWELVTTKEGLILKKINLMSEYNDVKEKIKIAEKFQDEFEADDSIDLLKQKQVKIKVEINELTKLIKSI